APFAAQACRFLPRRRIDGGLRGASAEVGHLLRSPDTSETGLSVESATAPIRVEIAIVGAGPSGLSAAWRLERLSESRYVVFDLEPEPGGTSTFGTDGVVPYPWGAHYVPLPSAENR